MHEINAVIIWKKKNAPTAPKTLHPIGSFSSKQRPERRVGGIYKNERRRGRGSAGTSAAFRRFRQTDILRPAKDRRRPLPQRCRKSDLQMRSGGHFCWRFLFSLLPHRFPADVQNKNKITHFVRTTFIPIQGLMADHQDPNTNIPIERQKKDTFTGSDRHSLAFVLCFFLCFVSSASCPPNPNPKYSTFVAATPLTQNAHVVWRLKGKLKQFIFVGHPSGLQGSFFRSFWGAEVH